MTLSEWLRSQNMSHEEFAERIGRDRSAVTRYVNGTRMPRREVLEQIADVTDGAVTANDFVEPPAPAPEPIIGTGA